MNSLAQGFESIVEGEEVVSLPSSFVKFSSSLGMPVVGLEKEISSLLKKLNSRKGRGVKEVREKEEIFAFFLFWEGNPKAREFG